jgi:cytochrome b
VDIEERRKPTRVKVWDAPTRTFHWALVVLIALLWWSEKSNDIAFHKLTGFAVVGLIVFRVYWGLAGSSTAKFSSFLYGPREIWRYLRGRAAPTLGHNPLGGISVVVMLSLVAVESVLGLFAIDEDGLESGPLAPMIGLDWAQVAAHWHALVFDALLVAIAAHVVAVFAYWAGGNDLVLPMITGRKRLLADVVAPAPAPFWSILVGVALAAAVSYGLWRLDNS